MGCAGSVGGKSGQAASARFHHSFFSSPKTARAPLIQSWFTLLASTTIERDGEVMFSSS
jgi:hypothetical protein